MSDMGNGFAGIPEHLHLSNIPKGGIMAHQPKWSVTIEDVRGTYVILVFRGQSKEGIGSADDLDAALDIAKELFVDCRKHRGESPAAQPTPSQPTGSSHES
jgi:hypothetical protein